MSMNMFVSIGFLFHSLVASFCIMPTTFAAEMPMPHVEHLEMVMTPMFPMSPVDCKYCIQLTKQNDAPMNEMCSGHCLAKAHDALVAVIPPSAHSISITVPHTFDPYFGSSSIAPRILASTAPPRHLAMTRTVVMIH